MSRAGTPVPPAGTPLSPAASPRRLRRDLETGFKGGLVAFWEMARVMVPAYLVALVLDRIGAVDALAQVAAPVMHLVGLPGDAAMPLVVAWVLNLYAAVGAMQPLSLTPQEITVLALAILIGHNLIVESAVTQRTGMNGVAFGLLRALGGLLAAGMANQLMGLF